jgi:hypothetical protein
LIWSPFKLVVHSSSYIRLETYQDRDPASRTPLGEAQTASFCLLFVSFRRGESGELVPHEGEQEAVREMVALRSQGKPLRAIAEAVRTKDLKISHEGVAGVLRAVGPS